MAESDQQDPFDRQEAEARLDDSQFRDLPTSDEWGLLISFFDTMLWVSEYLVANEEWSQEPPERVIAADLWRKLQLKDNKEPYVIWNELVAAEHQIRLLCEAGKLQASGFKATNTGVDPVYSSIPPEYWPRLTVDVTNGQPDDDRRRHGYREYGEASWLDPRDADRPGEVAWIGVCFRKTDILRLWPMAEKIAAPSYERPRRGRKPQYDWEDAEDFILQLLSENGEFKAWDEPGWRWQADLERKVLAYMSKHGPEPSESMVRAHVSAVLKKWRAEAEN